ncbi:tRNA (32-2'-O)-methyltransferase regulator THADA-like isoform X2 [Argopecten irradians]|uniref:tRNA (32-2'-O)-methyltransferase regulator THADA-like isoform X2 n=1 Tax=Argopecten irradians TaxID=31199 RepID=UPI00371B9D34
MATSTQRSALAADDHLDVEFSQYISAPLTEEKAGFMYRLKQLFARNDVKEQIPMLKEMCAGLKEQLPDDELTLPLQVLVNIYLNCQPKHPVKRILASTFQNYPPCIRDKVDRILTEHIQTKISTNQVTVKTDQRSLVDMVSCLMENFKLGEHCLGCIGLPVLKFLSEALSQFINLFSKSISPVKQNELMHSCLATLQTTNRMLQKCHMALMETLTKSESQESFQRYASAFMVSNMEVLGSENFMLDCKTSCGMNLALLLKLICPQEVVSQLLPTVLRRPQCQAPRYPWLETLHTQNTLTPTSHLCMCYGLFAHLDPADLLYEFSDNACLLMDVFPDEFLKLNSQCEDTGSKLLLAKSICLWTVRASACLKTDCVPPSMRSRLKGDEVTLQKILQYVWATWEDTVDAIRLNARDTFTNSLKVHALAQQTEPSQDHFLLELARTLILNISWSCKGKYGSLCGIVGYVGTTHFLSVLPSMPRDILEQMKEQTLACYASELYQKICEAHQRETNEAHQGEINGDLQTKWLKLWVNPVLEVLSGNHKLHKLHIMEYILPKLLKNGKTTLYHMVQQLTRDTSKDSSDHRLGALVTCLRRARVMGLLQNQESGSEECLYGAVSVTVIKQAMAHNDEQVRLDVLALLCENQRSTEVISKTEFDLLKQFLPWNLNNQSPSFRQHLLAHLKKLLYRLQESQVTLRRNMKNQKTDPDLRNSYRVLLDSYQDFVVWLVEHQFLCLSGSSFARRTTCLSILSLVITTLPYTGEDLGFDFASCVHASNLQSLLECLTDTFEENKMEATKILQYCCQNSKDKKALTDLEPLFDTALTLAASTRPQDCTTAVYLFKVLLVQPGIFDILKNFERCQKRLFLTKQRESFSLPTVDDSQSGRSLLLLWILLSYLLDQKEVAKGSLIMAAANRPLYPTLHCIRYILFDVALKNLPQNQSLPYWQTFIQNLITACLEISEIVSPVVHNTSPEGNVPVEAIGGLNLDTLLDPNSLKDAERSKETVMLMPEYLVVCCWRNIKEVSLLLGQLNLVTPISNPERSDPGGLLSCDQILVMGEYFKKQLLESVHRGAFELAYAGFVKMADMLWRSTIQELHELPQRWLLEVMTDIEADNPESKLCSTRRSAGVPFYIQTLVTTEPTSTGRPCFKQAMTDLLNMALLDNKGQESVSNPQVHALNTLRSLYRDTRLADDVAPFVADGLRAAILGFQNPFWAVRNSATLLLSALITRIFGVKRSKDEGTVSKKNCQTGRAFFHRYPSLYKFLLDQLAEATENIGNSDGTLYLHPSLYPILMVLGRLFPSHLEGADTSLNLAAFIPYVIKCSSSAVYKTRIMSAKALHPLVLPDQLTSVLTQLLDMLPDSVTKTTNQNLIHGVLPQIHQLTQNLNSVSEMVKLQAGQLLLSKWCDKIWLITRRNMCFMTRTEALNVTRKIMKIYSTSEDVRILGTLKVIREQYVKVLQQELDLFDLKDQLQLAGFTEFIVTVARLELMSDHVKGGNSSIISLLSKLLLCGYYEVRMIVLLFIRDIFCGGQSEDSPDDARMPVFHAVDVSRELSGDQLDCVRCEIGKSVEILDLLIRRAMSVEDHYECIIQILETCLYKIETNPRDEIRAAVLQFSGVLITAVIQHTHDTRGAEADNLEQIERWLTVLKDHSSSEQCPLLQVSCAKVIGQNVELLLIDPNNRLGDLTFEFWTVLVNLLQEDDGQVKQVTTEALAKLCEGSGIVQPFLSLDLLIGQLVRYHGNTERCKGCLTTLVKWIKGDSSDNSEVEERLFDKGEMNTYREDVIFVQLVIKHLAKLLLQLTNDQSLTTKPGQAGDIERKGDNSTCNTKLDYVVRYCEKHFPSQEMDQQPIRSPNPKHAGFGLSDIEIIFKETLDTLHTAIEAQEAISVSSPFLVVSWYRTVFPNIYKTLMLMNLAQCLSASLQNQCDVIRLCIRSKLGEQTPVINALVGSAMD